MQDLYFGILGESRGPAVFEVAQARRLTFNADVLVEGNRFANRAEIRRRVSSDLFKLANVVVAAFAGGH